LPDGRLVAADLHDITFESPGRPPLLLPTNQVHSVSVLSHRQGAATGALIGVGAAVVLGIISGAVAGSSNIPDCQWFCDQGSRTVLSTFMFGLMTVPIGAVAGAAGGRRSSFVFGAAPPDPPPGASRPTKPDPWIQ
jgi:hypothetical protein